MTQSEQLLQRATRVIPGGVNSPVRAFNAVGGKPIFMQRGAGACLFDVDGSRYVDYVGAFGPAIVGHCHPIVRAAVVSAAADGLGFGASTELEVRLAERLCTMLPSLDLVRMVNSGTEATMSAIRLARGHTGRDLLVKFSGCYHGHSDSLLVNAGSGAMTLGVPSSPGVPAALAELTLSLTYNDLDEARNVFESQGEQIACVIVEPIAGNMNCVLPAPGFLQGLRELCDQHGAVLIFDEVMTGFRVGAGGAQGLLDVTPDLTTLGKVIGGGMPVGAFGGRREIMERIAPLGPVYQAGTLSGSPLAMAAGLATLELTEEPGFYARLEDHTARLCDGVQAIAREAGVPFTTNRIGAMFGWFFSDTEVCSLADVERSELSRFAPFFTAMLQGGVFLAPSPFEAGFLSSAHDEATLEQTLDAARAAVRTL